MFIWNFSSSSSQYVPLGSLYQVLHEGSGLVVDASKAIQFAIDVAKVLDSNLNIKNLDIVKFSI